MNPPKRPQPQVATTCRGSVHRPDPIRLRNRKSATSAFRVPNSTVSSLVLSLLLLLLFQTGGRAAAVENPLPFAMGFLVTGDYVAAGVNLTEQDNPVGPDGLSVGTINISGVPADADIVAAYMDYETITYTA